MPEVSAGLLGQAVAFYLFAFMAVVSAWCIVFSTNLVRSASLLLLTLGGVAGLFFLLNQEFLAAIQLIVYAGGTLILIIFTVLLTARANQPQKVSPSNKIISLLAGVLAMVGLLVLFAVFTITPEARTNLIDSQSASPAAVSNIGRAMLTVYLVPFQVTGLVLLLVMIGASYLARKTGSDKQASGQPKPNATSPSEEAES